MCRKKDFQFLFRLGLNAIKRLWCNADTQMLLAFSSIMVNLHSKSFFFQYMHFFFDGTKYVVLLQLLFLYTSAIFTSNYGIICSVRMQTPKVLFQIAQYEVEKGINNSSKLLDLDRNMFLWVLLKLLYLLTRYFLTLLPIRHFSTQQRPVS